MKKIREPAKIVQKVPELLRGGAVLDIGASMGRHAIYLAEAGFDITALEPEGEFLEVLHRRLKERNLKMEVVQQDVLSYAPQKTFDAVLAVSVLHFLRNKDEVQQAIQRMKSWTNPGGLNVVNVMLNKEVNNPRPYLFAAGELKAYYDDWEMVFYEETLGGLYTPSESSAAIRSHVARLIARKAGT